jgi:hypothetical protein
MPGLIDFFTLCNVGILFNVLDSRTYGTADETEGDSLLMERHDFNTISEDDRRKFVYGRGLSLELLHWAETMFMVFDNDRNEEYKIGDVYDQHITQLGMYMLQYLEHWIQDELETADPQLPFFDVTALKKQLDWVMLTVPWLAIEWTEEKMYFSLHVEYSPSFQVLLLDGNLTHKPWCKLFYFFIIIHI